MNRNLNRYIDTLLGSEIFSGFTPADMQHVFELSRARVVEFRKDEAVYRYGDAVREMGVVLEGTIIVEANNAEGEKTNLNILMQGDEFGVYLVVSGARRSPMSVYAASRSKVMYFDIERMSQLQNKDRVIWKMMDNLLHSFADKLVDHYRRLHIYGQKRVRSRVRMYLMSLEREDDVVVLPLNRTDWAAYLGVDRTALARELSRMRDEGLIGIDKRRIRLLNTAFFEAAGVPASEQ